MTIYGPAGTGALLANVANNLPAYLVLEPVAADAAPRLMALLVGVNAGPLVTPWAPDAYSLAITAAVCAVQHVTSRHWHAGVPDEFCKPGSRPRCRRATDVRMSHGQD